MIAERHKMDQDKSTVLQTEFWVQAQWLYVEPLGVNAIPMCTSENKWATRSPVCIGLRSRQIRYHNNRKLSLTCTDLAIHNTNNMPRRDWYSNFFTHCSHSSDCNPESIACNICHDKCYPKWLERRRKLYFQSTAPYSGGIKSRMSSFYAYWGKIGLLSTSVGRFFALEFHFGGKKCHRTGFTGNPNHLTNVLLQKRPNLSNDYYLTAILLIGTN